MSGLTVIHNPTLPPRRTRVLSPTFHSEHSDAAMDRLLAEWKPKAIKGMTGSQLSLAWLVRQVPRMQPGSYLHCRVYYTQANGAVFDSDRFPAHLPAKTIAENFEKALRPELETLQAQHGHCTPVIEAWCELGAEKPELDALVEIANLLRQRYPDVLLGAANQSIGTYNMQGYWQRVHESGLLKQDNVIFLVHGYAAVVDWSCHLPGWQAGDVAARWPTLRWESLPWNTYAVWDGENLPETWTMWGLLRGLYFLQHVYGYDLSRLRFGLSEINLDKAGPNGFRDRHNNEASERGWLAYARAGCFDRLRQPGMSDGEFMGHVLHHQSVQAELIAQHHPCIQYMTEFVFRDDHPAGWRDFVTEGVPHDTWMRLEGALGEAPDPDTTCYVTTSLAQVNVRTRPLVDNSTYFDPRLFIYRGEKYRAIGTAKGPNDSTWHVVDFKGFKGYIAGGQYSQLVGDCTALPDETVHDDDIEALKQQVADLTESLRRATATIATLETTLQVKEAALGILLSKQNRINTVLKESL